MRFNWFTSHPAYCYCVECERGRFRHPVKAFLKGVVVTSLLTLLIILLALVLSDSLRGRLLDSMDIPDSAPLGMLPTPEQLSRDEVGNRAGFLSEQLFLMEYCTLLCPNSCAPPDWKGPVHA